jgi:hypothetical protein
LNGQELIDYLKSAQIGNMGKLFVPVARPQDVSEIISFEGFGIVNPADFFNRGWKFLVQDASNSQNLQAFCAGTIKYDNSRIPNRIILRNADAIGNLIRTHDSLPHWFPLPNYIIYENIQERETKNLMRIYLRNHPKIVRVIEEQFQENIPIDQIVELFASNSLPYGIPVQAGDIIGVMNEEQPGTSGSRTLILNMQHELDNITGLYLDPAIYHKHWETFFQDLAGHPLEMRLKKIFAGPIANGVIRYVKSGGASTGDFLDPAFPAGLVSIALTAATPFDTIVIMDDATYNEPNEIIIDKAINITSLNTHDVIYEQASFPFPTLDGNLSHRIIRIGKTDGIVSISNIGISRGITSPGNNSTKPYAGGGILIAYNEKTYVRNCHVSNNIASRESIEDDGFGGGICAYHSSALIYHNRISGNNGFRTGGGIGIFGYGWPIIHDNYIFQNESDDGGGIGIESAVPTDKDWTDLFGDVEDAFDATLVASAKKRCHRLVKNEIDSNLAHDDGGGVYMTALAKTVFSDNNIHNNRSKGAGGGIRATLGSDLMLKNDYIHHNSANTQHGKNGGGGIGVRNCSIDSIDVRIEDNLVEGWAGGGIFFASNSEGTFYVGSIPAFSWDEVLRGVYGKTNNVMKIKGTSSIFRNHCQLIPSLGEHRKGGGIYGLRTYDPIENFVGLPATIFFNDINRILSNILDQPPPPAFPNSAQIHLEDMYRGNGELPPIDDSNNVEFLTPKFGRMEFLYEPVK